MTTSKAEQAYTILKEKIMDGTFGPGHRLVIDQLGREYNISSVPWRESLRRLEAEGWVDIERNVGSFVKKVDTGSWQKTMRLLARLEGLATALSASHLTEEDLAEARSLNTRMREALNEVNPVHFGRLNRRFHELLCSRCDDQRLRDLVSAEWTRLDMIRRSAFWYAPGRARASLSEHDQIIDLVTGGADPDLIETVVIRHEMKTIEEALEQERSDRERQAAEQRR